jgi:dTMP kinase
MARKRTTPPNLPRGRLIAFEGIDGSGKSTQLHLLEQYLKHKGLKVFRTEWNSSESVKETISRGKKKGLLTPITFSLLHATDFSDRYEKNILPLLQAGYIVLADRYIYTALARDPARENDRAWVRKVYSFAVKPDVTLYFRVTVDLAARRILAGRAKFKYYEAGMDLRLSSDPYESYRIFQGRVVDEYEALARAGEFTIIDGTKDIEAMQRRVREVVDQILAGGSATAPATTLPKEEAEALAK